jgi:hypothetical protein
LPSAPLHPSALLLPRGGLLLGALGLLWILRLLGSLFHSLIPLLRTLLLLTLLHLLLLRALLLLCLRLSPPLLGLCLLRPGLLL